MHGVINAAMSVYATGASAGSMRSKRQGSVADAAGAYTQAPALAIGVAASPEPRRAFDRFAEPQRRPLTRFSARAYAQASRAAKHVSGLNIGYQLDMVTIAGVIHLRFLRYF